MSTILFRYSGAIRPFVADLDKRRRRGPREGRRGPLHGRRPRRSPRSRAGPLRPRAPRRALRTRKCSSNRHSRVQNAHLGEETDRSRSARIAAAAPPAPPRARPRHHDDPRPRTAVPGEKGSLSLSRRKDPGVGRERRDGAGGWVRCGCGSVVSGRVLPGSGARSGSATAVKKEDAGRGRARVCGIGAAWAVLHIRPGPAGGGSAESCGNAPALNAVEVLPCAEGSALHMGARPLETDVLVRTPESRGKARTGPRGRRPPMCSAGARAGKNRDRRAGSRQSRFIGVGG